MEPFLVIVTIILTVLLLLVNFYLLAIYCHPDDKGLGTSLILKILVMVGLTLSWASILLMPLDVANTRSKGGLDMITLWEAMFVIIAIDVLILLPFFIMLYETDE